MKARFAHVNLLARDWQRLAHFYTTVFGCVLVPPERNFQGKDLDAGTGLKNAHLRGAHFRLPGGHEQGPTLEIFTYDQLEPSSPAAANRPGFGHIAFEVEDVEAAWREVFSAGGGKVGEIVTLTTSTGAKITWCYVTDPEGNIIELQSWAARHVIRPCRPDDQERMFEIINGAAQAYRGVIAADCWKHPYMPLEELEHEIAQGVRFSGIEADGVLVGIMGVQSVKDVTLIRHAYFATEHRGKGLGGILLNHLLQQTKGPILVGTWAAATWAIRFYAKHGFRQVTPVEKDRLLRTYWSIPERQVETSVVLANAVWLDAC